LGQWEAANGAALPTANAGQYANTHCKLPQFWFPNKWPYINVWTLNLLTSAEDTAWAQCATPINLKADRTSLEAWTSFKCRNQNLTKEY